MGQLMRRDGRRRAMRLTMIMSSIPYIFLRPYLSARYPKPSCPIRVPTGVATFKPRSWLAASEGVAVVWGRYTYPIMVEAKLMATREEEENYGLSASVPGRFTT